MSANYEAPRCAFLSNLLSLIPFRSKYSPQHPVLKHPQSVLPLMSETMFHAHKKTRAKMILFYILIFTFLGSRQEDESSGLNGSKHCQILIFS
jgi:hypothetical protein